MDEGEYCEENDVETRYRHDSSTGQCQSFTYKGCAGNSNNYQTLVDCSRACGKFNLLLCSFNTNVKLK